MTNRPLRPSLGTWVARGLVTVAGAKVGVATASVGLALAAGLAGPNAGRAILLLLHALAFGIAGILLLGGRRMDPRAGDLGAVFVLTGSAFADHLLVPLWPHPSAAVVLARAVLALQVDAFTPYFLWRFVQAFPRAPSTPERDRGFARVIRACFVVGVVLLAVNVILFTAVVVPDVVPSIAGLAYLSRESPVGAYWGLQFGLVALAVLTLVRRIRLAPADERRRVVWLAMGLAASVTPSLVWSLLAIVPAFRAALPLRVAGWVVYPTLLSTPFTTAYAVLAHRALDVRVVVRRTLQYALARYTLLVAAAVPLAAFVWSVYRNRDASVADLLSSPRGALLGAFALLAIAAWRGRDVLLAYLDRHFFREQRRAEDVLGGLVAECSRTRDRSELAAVLRTALDHALHPHPLHVFFRDARRTALIVAEGDAPPLDLGGPLGMWLSRLDRPVDVSLTPSGAAAALGPAEQSWMADAGARLLVPVRDSEGDLTALLSLGEKRSELPYTKEDRMLLGTVADAVTLALASYRERPADAPCAAECPSCGRVYANGVAACAECEGEVPTRTAMLPHTIAERFALHQRIGAGGMGVVYQGVDLTLGRTVAIKTLPFVSRDDAERMRHEARAMATVMHENLALIYSAEVWHDRPMLVVEYLGGGTLADRLANGPLTLGEWRPLGIALASALAALHRKHVVHGDVKPSNIGFTSDHTPKLLDFGLAHVLPADGPGAAGYATGLRGPHPAGAGQGPRAELPGAGGSASRSVTFGTPRYMAPEACTRTRPTPADDLWSVCVVLYEAVVGCHPFGYTASVADGDSWTEGPDTRPLADAGAGELAALFRDALSADPSRRPPSAEHLRDSLLRLWGS